jgi:hypothetical protein
MAVQSETIPVQLAPLTIGLIYSKVGQNVNRPSPLPPFQYISTVSPVHTVLHFPRQLPCAFNTSALSQSK